MRKLISPLLALLPALALANGYDVPNVNARDLSMAGSLTAAQNDAAAAYANPAALSRLEGFSLSLTSTLLDIRSTWTADANNLPSDQAHSPVTDGFKPAYPFSAFLSYSGKLASLDDRGWGVGLGVNIPAGGNVYWPTDWPGRFRIITVNRRVYGLYLTGGFELIKEIRLGGGLVYYRSTEYLKQAISFVTSEGTGELSASGGALSFDLSAEIAPFQDLPLIFGIDYKHQGVQKLTGVGRFHDVPAAFLGSLQDQGVTNNLTYPNILNLAAAYRIIPPLLLTFGYTFNRYVVYATDVFNGDRGISIPVPRHYRNGWTYRLAGEYDLTSVVKVRGGILRDISGFNSQNVSATLPDGNTWAVTAGTAWTVIPDLDLEASVFYDKVDKVTVTGDVEFQGKYDTRTWIVALGLSWRIGKLW